MPESADFSDLIDFLVRTSRLSRAEATRVVDDVLSYLDETPEDFIRRRHLQLQGEGLPNAEIYRQLLNELAQRRFRAPCLSERQIRRVIYG